MLKLHAACLFCGGSLSSILFFPIFRRNVHGVSKEKIKRMLERYEHCLTANSILNSSISDDMRKRETCGEVLHREKRQG